MTGLMLDTARLPADEAENVAHIMALIDKNIHILNHTERTIYTTLWMYIARAAAPVVVASLNYRADTLRVALDKLIQQRLIWFDDDLRAVLQCPPFSALHTPHEVKAFGWDRAYTCSLIDAPLSLLVYGPNTWLHIQATCPRSGESLRFRVMLTSDHIFRLDTPAESRNWCIWVPAAPAGELSIGANGLRAKINAFNTRADFDTYHHYSPPAVQGTLYTLEQALYLSECLMLTFQSALTQDK